MTPSRARAVSAIRNGRNGYTSLVLACLLVLSAAPAAQAATSTNAWLAKVGSSGANGTVAIDAYTIGTGSIALKLAKLQKKTTLAVTLLKTSCTGPSLLKLTAVKTSSGGSVIRTFSLTAAQVTAIKKATTGTAKMAIRVGSGSTAKCGVFVVQPRPAYVAATITVGRAPSGVAIDATGVWVSNWYDNTLSRIDPATNSVLSVVPIALTGDEGLEAMTAGAGSLWVTTTEAVANELQAGSVVRVDPATASVLATIAVGRGAFDISFGFGAVWVPNLADNNVQRIDPTTNQVVATIPVPGPQGIAVDPAAVWIVAANGVITRIDPATNQVVATIYTQTTGGFIASGGGSVWVTHPGTWGLPDGSLSRINPATNQVVANIPVGAYPLGVSVAGGSVWVGMFGEARVVRINAANNAILSKLVVSNPVYVLEATDHAVWTVHNLRLAEGETVPPPGTVTRVGY